MALANISDFDGLSLFLMIPWVAITNVFCFSVLSQMQNSILVSKYLVLKYQTPCAMVQIIWDPFSDFANPMLKEFFP